MRHRAPHSRGPERPQGAFFHQLIDITVSLSPLALAMTLARIGLPAAASVLQFFLFLIASSARAFPTLSKRNVSAESVRKANSLVLAETLQP